MWDRIVRDIFPHLLSCNCVLRLDVRNFISPSIFASLAWDSIIQLHFVQKNLVFLHIRGNRDKNVENQGFFRYPQKESISLFLSFEYSRTTFSPRQTPKKGFSTPFLPICCLILFPRRAGDNKSGNKSTRAPDQARRNEFALEFNLARGGEDEWGFLSLSLGHGGSTPKRVEGLRRVWSLRRKNKTSFISPIKFFYGRRRFRR